MCVIFQVRVSRDVDDVRSSVTALRRSGLLLFAACVLFGLAGGRSRDIAVVLLLCAAFVHVCGELLQAAGSWGLGFGLAPDHLQGQYQGLFTMSYGVSNMLAPVVVTTVAVGGGLGGWVLIGLLLLGAALALGPIGRWAAANRPAAFGDMRGLRV
jgi:hypothetical protein